MRNFRGVRRNFGKVPKLQKNYLKLRQVSLHFRELSEILKKFPETSGKFQKLEESFQKFRAGWPQNRENRETAKNLKMTWKTGKTRHLSTTEMCFFSFFFLPIVIRRAYSVPFNRFSNDQDVFLFIHLLFTKQLSSAEEVIIITINHKSIIIKYTTKALVSIQ